MVNKIEQDHQRFRQIVRGKIRRDLRRFIAKGELIGKEGQRFVSIPIHDIDIPTFREQGFDFIAGASRGFVATPSIPIGIRQRLEAAFTGALSEPAFRADAEKLAMPLRPVGNSAACQPNSRSSVRGAR